ncbi:MAG: C40 family peptidase [Propionibacteriaceae bacterium]|jgi:cell wall-associated NlpC family hydrolase|nr:C40 family peptidase [Propionibacteriaceae bacterium]
MTGFPERTSKDVLILYHLRRAAAGLSVFLLALALVVVSPSVASADPNTVSQAKAELTRYEQEASELAEQYDAVNQRLEQTKRDIAQTETDITARQDKVDLLRGQVAQVVLRQWQTHGLGTTAALLLSENSTAMLHQLSANQRWTTSAEDLIQHYQGQQAELAELRAHLDAAVVQVQADNDRLADLKRQADAKVDAAERALARLQAAETGRLDLARQSVAADGSGRVNFVSDGSAAAVATAFAVAQVGKPYIYGGNGPTGYDCSGLTRAAYLQVGVALPHSASGQFRLGQPVAEADLRPGDLVFYYSGISHVGIYVGNGTIVDAANPRRGIRYTSLHSMPYMGARRII